MPDLEKRARELADQLYSRQTVSTTESDLLFREAMAPAILEALRAVERETLERVKARLDSALKECRSCDWLGLRAALAALEELESRNG